MCVCIYFSMYTHMHTQLLKLRKARKGNKSDINL